MLNIETIKTNFLGLFDERHGQDRILHRNVEMALEKNYLFFEEKHGYKKDPQLPIRIRNSVKLGFVWLREIIEEPSIQMLMNEDRESFITALVEASALFHTLEHLPDDNARYAYLYANLLYKLSDERYPSDMVARKAYREAIFNVHYVSMEIKDLVEEYFYTWNDVKWNIQ